MDKSFGLWTAAQGKPYSAAWGARAIFQNGSVDLLPDRQSWDGINETVVNAFVPVVNQILPELRNRVFDLWNRGQILMKF